MPKASISLILSGQHLEPARVTTACRVSPSRSHTARDPALRRALGDRAWETGQWELREADVGIDGIVPVIDRFAAMLTQIRERYAELGIERCTISVGLFELRAQGDAFYIEPPLMSSLLALNAVLMIDAYGSAGPDSG